MLTLEKVADLEVSAASGLVALGDELCVVADDELFLAVFDRSGAPLRRVPLFAGELPEAHKARKRAKPDLEALALLPDGRLLALGSGSTASRMRSACIDPHGESALRISDWSVLFAELRRDIAELNIEGAAVAEGRLWLAQRGNGASGLNALIELDLELARAALEAGAPIDARSLRAIHIVRLGAIDGAPLSLTDLAAVPGRGLLFSAAAEPSGSTYDDAPVTGSIVGLLTTRGAVVHQLRVAPTCKLEGIAIARDHLWLVADPDDRAQRAPLFRAAWPFSADP